MPLQRNGTNRRSLLHLGDPDVVFAFIVTARANREDTQGFGFIVAQALQQVSRLGTRNEADDLIGFRIWTRTLSIVARQKRTTAAAERLIFPFGHFAADSPGQDCDTTGTSSFDLSGT